MSTITVAVVGICSAVHINRCLESLSHQQDAPNFDTLVVYDPHIAGVEDISATHSDVQFIANEGQRSPLELASMAMGAATGDLILLTEDHCIASPDWVRTMVNAQSEDRAVVGGRVEIAPYTNATDWAFYFVDFFRYAAPVPRGPSISITVCNAAYRREDVQSIHDIWQSYFHETAINDALKKRYGELWIDPDSVVTMSRHVSLKDAIYERYAFGRLFSCTRIEFVTPLRRLYYTLLSPALPLIIMGRMMLKAVKSRKLAGAFLRSFGPLTLMTLSWSWGEWLGYVTGRKPKSLIVAPEIRAAQDAMSQS